MTPALFFDVPEKERLTAGKTRKTQRGVLSRIVETARGKVSPVGPAESVETSIHIGDVLAVLKNARRREVVREVAEHGSCDIRDLSNHIGALENGVDLTALTGQQRKRVYVSLYQTHLPRMDKLDVVDFNSDRGTIQETPKTHACFTVLQEIEGLDVVEGGVDP